jgi:hypothetical protein
MIACATIYTSERQPSMSSIITSGIVVRTALAAGSTGTSFNHSEGLVD